MFSKARLKRALGLVCCSLGSLGIGGWGGVFSCHVGRTLKQPWGEAHVTRNQGLLLTATWTSLETPYSLIKPSSADMTETSRQNWSQNHPEDTPKFSIHRNWDNKSLLFWTIHFEVTYYTTIRYPISSSFSPASQYIHKYARITSTEKKKKANRQKIFPSILLYSRAGRVNAFSMSKGRQ